MPRDDLPDDRADDAFARIDVHLLSLPTRASFHTAHDNEPTPDRQIVAVRVETTDGVVGWGECSALNKPTYTAEWARNSFDRLADWAGGGVPPDPSSHPMTFAAIEMASLDASLKRSGLSLASSLGASREAVPAGATIGLLSITEAVQSVEELVAAGYRRVKVKVAPGSVDDVPHELSHHFAELELQVDANGSLDERHLMDLASLNGHGVTVIEQPFAVDRPDLTAEFMSVCDTTVLADEAVNSIADAERLLALGALGGVAIKPPRVGGIDAASRLLTWCRTHGVPASVGGMLESGLGRHALAAIAACDGFTIIGDLSPARRWLAEDPWPDLTMIDGSILVPQGPGVAPQPDQALIERFTVERASSRTR